MPAEQRGETRACSLQDFSFELREGAAAADGSAMILEGYAVIFDSETTIGDITRGGFYEIIDRNAFTGCNMRDVPLKVEHSDSMPILARTRNNSLQLSVDDRGLKIRAELLDTQDARDMYKRVKSGLYNAMSFAFSVRENGEQITSRNGVPVRRITGFDRLFDTSIVSAPAYEATSIYARSLELAENWRADQQRAAAAEEEKQKEKEGAELRAALLRWGNYGR